VDENEHVRPEDGDGVAETVTVPRKPPRLLTVTVELPDAPGRIVREVGLGEIEKS